MPDKISQCLVCERTKEEIPLVSMVYREIELFICPEHLPVLIHHPDQLVGKLPGAEKLQPHTH